MEITTKRGVEFTFAKKQTLNSTSGFCDFFFSEKIILKESITVFKLKNNSFGKVISRKYMFAILTSRISMKFHEILVQKRS